MRMALAPLVATLPLCLLVAIGCLFLSPYSVLGRLPLYNRVWKIAVLTWGERHEPCGLIAAPSCEHRLPVLQIGYGALC
jgi:hypothetical protein